jgi:adenosine kinase
MINEAKSVGVLGSVGNDKYGELYERLLKQDSIIPIFEKFDNINTGICAVFCHNKDRGHVTDLGASTSISNEYVNGIYENFKNVELIFTELFILKHKKSIVYSLAELGSSSDRKIFGFNLPSFYFIENFLEDIMNLFEHADVVFANKAEAMFLGQLLGISDCDNVSLLCQNLAKIKKKNKTKKRVLVITCGPTPAVACEFDFTQNQISFSGVFPPEYVSDELIIDTNGAGDAFAGGFLSKLVKGRNIEECIKAGHWAAALIIQKRGCQIPEKCEYGN